VLCCVRPCLIEIEIGGGEWREGKERGERRRGFQAK